MESDIFFQRRSIRVLIQRIKVTTPFFFIVYHIGIRFIGMKCSSLSYTAIVFSNMARIFDRLLFEFTKKKMNARRYSHVQPVLQDYSIVRIGRSAIVFVLQRALMAKILIL